MLKSRRQSWQIPVHANRVEKYSSYMLTIGQGRRLCPLKTQNVMEDLEFRGLQPYRRGCRRKRSSWLHSLFVDKSPCVEFNGTHAQYDSIDALTVSHTTSIAACIERASRRPILKSGVHTGRDSLRPSDSGRKFRCQVQQRPGETVETSAEAREKPDDAAANPAQ
jgi:hypothetical protein